MNQENENTLSSPSRMEKRSKGVLPSSRDSKAVVQFDSWLEEATAGDDPLIAGPWVSEVGWELLYWIPFLRWAVRKRPEIKDRLVVISRGGVASWYRGIARHYIDAFELMSVDEMSARRREEEGERRALMKTPRRPAPELNSLLVQRACAQFGIERHQIVDQAMVFRIVQNFACEPLGEIESRLLFEPIKAPPPPPDIDLPDGFIAVRFYSGPAIPNRRAANVVGPLIETLARLAPIVLLDPGLKLDEHRDLSLDSWDAIRFPPLDPAKNLGVQTSIIARSALFVGSYGGLSYLGPLLGVSTLALLIGRSDSKSLPMPADTRRADRPFTYGHFHLAIARRAFSEPGFGAYHVLERGDDLELACLRRVERAIHRLESRRGAREPSRTSRLVQVAQKRAARRSARGPAPGNVARSSCEGGRGRSGSSATGSLSARFRKVFAPRSGGGSSPIRRPEP